MAGELKELRRTVALELWGNRHAVKALEEISRAYREMLVELVDYAVRYRASLKTHSTGCSTINIGLGIPGYPRGL